MSEPHAAHDAHFRHMARALQLARLGRYSSQPNPHVGCVIVKDGVCVGEGYHRRAGEAHAEVNALNAAGAQSKGATVYVTLEPCNHHGRTPPCSEQLIAAGVARVIFAGHDPNPNVAGRGAEVLRAAGIETIAGILETDAMRLNRGFYHRANTQRPFVTVKIAMSLDGKVGLLNGESKWITGPEARADVQRLRAASGAIVTGRGTVATDDPLFTVRDGQIDHADRQPLRVILDSRLQLREDHQIFRQPGETIIFATGAQPADRERFERVGVEVVITQADAERVDLNELLVELARRECDEVLVEAGPSLVSEFLTHDFCNELVIYMAPKIIGQSGLPALPMAPIQALLDAHEFHFHEVIQVGQDLRITARPAC